MRTGRWIVAVALAAAVPWTVAASPAQAATTTEVATTTVNIRSGPSTTAAIVGGLDRGQRITVTGKAADGWVRVRFNRTTAYMFGTYLTRRLATIPAPTSADASKPRVTTEDLNVRGSATTKASVVAVLAEGTAVTLTGRYSNGFAETTYGGAARWVSLAYVARIAGSAALDPTYSAARGQRVLDFAKKQLGKPYKYGAEGPKAYDCSGLTWAAYRTVGINLPRTSQAQFTVGQKIRKSDLQIGDLVFFYGSKPGHVAIYAGDGLVIHAPRPGKKIQYLKMKYMPYSGARRP